jgi:hypothetical protein
VTHVPKRPNGAATPAGGGNLDGSSPPPAGRARVNRVPIETASVTVRVSPELLAQMGEWSEPLEVKIELDAGEYSMVFRRPEGPRDD